MGGHCHTRVVDGFLFDEGAHVFFGRDDISRALVLDPLAGELLHHRAEVWNDYGSARFGRYPVQANLHALPPDVATECVLDFVAASARPESEPGDYEEWCRASFGNAMAERFMLRYARKIWTVAPSELNTEWLGSSVGGRVIRPSLAQVVRGALDPNPQDLSYYSEFWYPRRGGFQTILEPVTSGLERVRLSCGATRIDCGRRCLELADGSSRDFDFIVSTIPLPVLVDLIPDAPHEIRAASAGLMWTGVCCVNLGVDRDTLGPGHWVYFYDESVPFFRVSFPSKFAPDNAPSGCGSLTCEIAYSRRAPLGGRELGRECRDALVREGILRDSDRILVQDVTDAPFGYVVYDRNRRPALEQIHRWLERLGIFPCGRFGEWGYHWSFDALESGKRAAERVRAVSA
jgi:protoporphyrinogen oxidase